MLMAFQPGPCPDGAPILEIVTTNHPAAQMPILRSIVASSPNNWLLIPGLRFSCHEYPHLLTIPRYVSEEALTCHRFPPGWMQPPHLLSLAPLTALQPFPCTQSGLPNVQLIRPLSSFLHPLLIYLPKTYCVPGVMLPWEDLCLKSRVVPIPPRETYKKHLRYQELRDAQ